MGSKRAYIKERLTKSYRELADKSEKSDVFVVCQEKSFDELLSIIPIKLPKRGEERAVKFLVSLIFSLFFSFLPDFFGRFSLLPDFSTFSLISLLRGLFYVLLHHSASFPHILKEGKHTKHVCHVVIFRCSHTTFRFCHVSLRL